MVTATALALAACGSSGPGVSASAARSLHAEIAGLRDAAGRLDRAATTAQTDRIALLITQLRGRHAIDAEAARRLRRALDAVRAQVVLIPLPTTTTTTTTTTAPEHGKGHGDKPKKHEEDRHSGPPEHARP
jgi:hypothetical protein